jgi:glycerophosphoryl diester phosphodiesterase
MIKVTEVIKLSLVITLVFACHVAKKTEDPLLPAFDIEGHRGCRGLMPENNARNGRRDH